MPTQHGPVNVTRFASGDVLVAEAVDDPGFSFRLTQDQAAELGNTLNATANRLQAGRDEITTAAIQADQQRVIDDALRVTEVLP